ncbi:MAG: site-2 protease family protein [archaeon]
MDLLLASIIIFYSLVLIWIIANRKKFQIESKIIALYKTSIGIKFIDNVGKKYSELIKILGYIGIGVGFIGMVYMSWYLTTGFYNLFFKPEAAAVISPVIPGVKIPGAAVFVPFWYGIFSLFVVTIVHEAAHGVVAKAHGLKINATGIAFFGPILAAFVEPDEKQLRKQKDIVQYSIFAAGPFSNVLLALLAIFVLGAVFAPLQNAMVKTEGYSFYAITPYGAAFNASVPASVVFNDLNGVKIDSERQFVQIISNLKPGDLVTISNKENTYSFNAVPSPANASKALIGISGTTQDSIVQIVKSKELKEDNSFNRIAYVVLEVLNKLLFWIFALSFGIGLANLLPLGPVDGGRMFQIASEKIIGNKEKANNVWVKVGFITLMIIVILLIVPIIRELLKNIKIF